MSRISAVPRLRKFAPTVWRRECTARRTFWPISSAPMTPGHFRMQYGHWLCERAARSSNFSGGAEGIRTPDPLRAREVLSQLSYSPW